LLVHFPERRIGVRPELAEIYATIEAATPPPQARGR